MAEFEKELESELKCRTHKLDLIPMYCKDCESPVCYDCLTDNHKKHELGKVSEIADEYKQYIQDCFQGCNSKSDELKDIRAKIEEKRNFLQIRRETVKTEILSRKEDLIDEINRAEKKETNKVEQIIQKVDETMASDICDIDRVLCKRDLNLKSEKEQIYCVFLNSEMKRLLDKKKSYMKTEDINLSFHVPESRSSDGSCTNFQFGQVLQENDLLSDSSDEINEALTKTSTVEERHTKYLHCSMKNIKRLVPVSESELYIQSSTCLYHCILSGGKISATEIHVDIIDFTVPRQNEVLVVLKDRKVIKKMRNKISSTFLQYKFNINTSIVAVDKGCSDTYAYIMIEKKPNNSLFYVEQGKKEMFLFKVNDIGIINSKMLFSSDFKGYDMSFRSVFGDSLLCTYTWTCYFDSERLVHLYKPKEDSSSLSCSNTYSGCIGFEPERFRPTDFCVDSEQNILIVANGDNAVHLLNKDCKFVKLLMTEEDGLIEPLSIALDNKRNMWVGCENGTIHVVKL